MIYWLGFRPRPRTLFYSPSLTFKYVIAPEMGEFFRSMDWRRKDGV